MNMNNNKNYIESFINNIVRSGRTSVPETINFGEYFNRCIQDPNIARNSSQRIYDMILSHGTSKDSESGKIYYNFFRNKMFGSEEPIERIMEYFKAASLGLDIKKRVLLLLGPPGGGKSLFLQLLKNGLRDYTRTEKGAMYRVKGCPLNEDPLNLIEDQSARDDIFKKYGIKITGRPCPRCKHLLESDWHKNLSVSVEVERFFIDEDQRQGIGTFAPSEKNDMSELYGDINQRTVQEIGDEADPRSFSFTGELHKANRGIMEFIEVLKADSKFLHVLLSLAEEEEFKTPRFPLISVDEALIAHTNESEFIKFINIKQNEAIVDRLFIVNMPYNLDPKNEELIYHSAIKKNLNVDGMFISPGAIRFASEYVISTRFTETDGVSEEDEIKNLRNGMSGLSPRFVLNALALSLTRDLEYNTVSPRILYETMRDMIINYPVLSENQRGAYVNWMDELFITNEDRYNNVTINDVDTKFLSDRGNSGFSLI